MEKVEGIVSEIVFTNEGNGYTIAHVSTDDDDIVVVGCMPTISVGESIEATGKWTNHKKYGLQFQADSFVPVKPATLEGVYLYLASGMIGGIKEKMANRIVEKFGLDTLDIIQNDPERLLEVDGIGRKTVKKIVKSFEDDKELRNIIVELSPYGITPTYCLRIYKTYKEKSLEVISQNPYRLAGDIRGIGFKKADKIAEKIGIPKDSRDRVSQGILFVLDSALNDGNTCLPKNILTDESKNLLEVDNDVIGECMYELILASKLQIEKINGVEYVYLMKYFLAENGVCSKIAKLTQFEFTDLNLDIDEEIRSVEQSEDIKLADNQREAVRECVENGLVIVTGGPGTGKTTTINSIIKIFEKNDKEVMLTAPTGRAAKRMSETTGKEAKTIHRLLEMGMSTEDNLVFFKNEDEPIKADVIIVDEVSMVDIMLMYNLLKAVSLGTRLILVGDSDQLPSVGAGNVLKDMIDSQVVTTVRLTEIFRQAQESMIVVNAHRINSGKPLYLNSKDKDFFFIQKNAQTDILNEIIGLVGERLPKFYGFDKLKDIQILSPMRKGEAGVNNLNAELQKYLNPKDRLKQEEAFGSRVFRVGDKVMQIKNNYSKTWENEDETESGDGVYNGDIGYVYHIDKSDKKLYVIFDSERIVEYEFSELDEIEHSFCTTIHKSQGSEFPAVVIPITWAPPMLLSRNLLYTAVTRAKNLVVLVGEVRFLEYMIKNNRVNDRYSELAYKLNKFKREGIMV
ncbi:MAG: ATP-dependent RecD-like DNA helicase [Clostridioides sp.]|nr:ATP-dependent RecD-like DNA helicase [Clostridioides sp.]